jgi:UDP-N-acetylmuramoyl-L-alanyl-D-glutamate--2,6-diaminopimelate ligase
MLLRELLAGIEGAAVSGDAGVRVSSLAYDSREAGGGTAFVALRGEKADGHRFVFDVAARGAAAVVSELPRPWSPEWDALAAQGLPRQDWPATPAWVRVPHARRALAALATNFYGRPAEALRLVGITGTNGKTTTTYLVDSILRAAGCVSGMFGTVVHRTPRRAEKAKFTTPESLELQRFFAEVRDAGGTHAVLEVSSHALAMDRVWGCPFAVAVFTNLTRDHLDFHKTFEEYFAAKRRLFEGTGGGAPAVGVVNADDPYAKQLVGLARRTVTYGLGNGAEVTAKKFALTFAGLEFTAETPAGRVEVRSPLVGRTNVYNILAAIAAGLALGLDRAAIEAGVHGLASVPGRFERVDLGQLFLVVVDYAHTDDALRKLMETARELNPQGRVLLLFGCGGDRDRTKRPLMGEVAGSLADLVVLTSDNPRSEDPLRILNDVVVGLQKTQGKYVVEPDRAQAVERLLDEARPGDILLLAGKGHENYQILRERTIEFSDRETARAALARRGYAKQADSETAQGKQGA